MICPKCGTELDDGAVFCTQCGARLDGTAAPAAAPDAVPVTPNDGQDQTPDDAADQLLAKKPAKKKHSHAKAAIVAGLVAVLALGGGAGYYFGIYAPGQRRAAAEKLAYERAHGLVYVAISVSGDGWDTTAGSSRLPVHVTGTDADGDVDEVQYVSSDGSGLELHPGSYTFSVPASPVAADGGIYSVPNATFSVSIDNGSDVDPDSPDVPATPDEVGEVPDADYDASADVKIDLSRADMAEVSDEEVKAAQDYLEKDDGLDGSVASTLKDALTTSRNDALEQKRQAEEAAAKKAAEEAAAAAKQKAIDDLVSRATSINYDVGTKADGSDSTSFKFERKQTSDAAGSLATHRASGFYTVAVYSGNDEATAKAVAMYLFKLDLEGKLIQGTDWSSLGSSGGYVAIAGIYDTESQAQAQEQKLEAQGITCGTVVFTGPHR